MGKRLARDVTETQTQYQRVSANTPSRSISHNAIVTRCDARRDASSKEVHQGRRLNRQECPGHSCPLGQRIIAFNLACPHENTALKWRDGDERFQCPKHESKYTPEGVFTEGRATRNMDRLAIRREGMQVIVGLDRLFKSDQNAADWAAAVVTL
jgi:Rieske Fe-S protein